MVTITDNEYLEQLFDIRKKLISFYDLIIEKNEITYIRDISIKLRILLIDKSGRKCLLKEIENILKIDIFVAIRYSLKEKVTKGLLPYSFLNGLIFNQTNSVADWFSIDQRTSEIISIFEALNRKEELVIDNKEFSYKELIETVADKMGGAHIDKTIDDEKLIPHNKFLLIGGMTVSDRAIFDTCKTIIELINQIEVFINDSKETNFIKSIRNNLTR